MTSMLIAIENANLGYRGSEPVLRNISVNVETGEFIALVGENGSGKTTVLRSLLGLLPPLSGRIVYANNFKRSCLGYVPQHSTLDPLFPLTVFEVVMMGLYPKIGRFSAISTDAKKCALHALESVGLEKHAQKLFSVLSGGQKQRALVARALVNSPSVLFLDEPTAGVDMQAENEIMRYLTDLNQNHKLTVVLVTHHLTFVSSQLQTCILVGNGQAIKGSTLDLIKNNHDLLPSLT